MTRLRAWHDWANDNPACQFIVLAAWFLFCLYGLPFWAALMGVTQ